MQTLIIQLGDDLLANDKTAKDESFAWIFKTDSDVWADKKMGGEKIGGFFCQSSPRLGSVQPFVVAAAAQDEASALARRWMGRKINLSGVTP